MWDYGGEQMVEVLIQGRCCVIGPNDKRGELEK